MRFTTDKQTLDDLNILGRYKHHSIFSLFNHVITKEASRRLEQMFIEPLDSIKNINEIANTFQFFQELKVSLPFTAKEFNGMEQYLKNRQSKNRFLAATHICKSKFLNFAVNDKNYPLLKNGLLDTIKILTALRPLVESIEKQAHNITYYETAKRMLDYMNSKYLQPVFQFSKANDLKFIDVLKLDYLLRGLLQKENSIFLNDIYNMDIYIAVSNIARKNSFTYSKMVSREENKIDIKGVFHPSIPNAVDNDVCIGKEKNVMFLTGANMAGKSTFMKSFAVAVYLAHMGFPVAAKSMTVSLHDGIYTSINVPDNLDKGHSHFYAEVMRVKHVAQEVASNKQLVIIFDELFKGTNVKDAYDGTVAIVDAFSKRKGKYIISTHIMEAGQYLKENNHRLFFQYLPTIVKKGKVPTYPYKLEDGITDDRQGMMIIENENILEIIRNG